MKFAFRWAIPIALGVLSSPVFAAGDAERGETLAYTCLGCHGIEGYRNAYPSYRVPKLGGQKAEYIAAALRGYRAGERQHGTMKGQAVSLSDQEIDDLAAYFGSYENDTIAAGGDDAPAFDKTATCVACHGNNGIGVQPTWPTLAGQYESYLEHALKQYRSGERTNALMMPQASNLTDADIKALAAYYADLDGLETTLPEDD
jgi:cytochrome c553